MASITWLDGLPVSNCPVVAGGTNFFDLAHNPAAFMEDPFHAPMFYIPRGALTELRSEPGIVLADLAQACGLSARVGTTPGLWRELRITL